jgi:hypothetical protein
MTTYDDFDEIVIMLMMIWDRHNPYDDTELSRALWGGHTRLAYVLNL